MRNGLAVAAQGNERLGEHLAGLEEVGDGGRDFAQRRESLVRASQTQVGGARHDQSGDDAGLAFQGRLELLDGFAVLAGEVIGHAEVRAEARVVGQGPDGFLIDLRGFGVAAGGHHPIRLPHPVGDVLRLGEADGGAQQAGGEQSPHTKQDALPEHGCQPGPPLRRGAVTSSAGRGGWGQKLSSSCRSSSRNRASSRT